MATVAELPGGLCLSDGGVALEAELRPLAGADEEWLAWASPSLTGAAVVSELLARTVARVGGFAPGLDGCRALLAGDRDYLLLCLRRETLGPHVSARTSCPACGEPFDLDFEVDDVPVERRPQSGAGVYETEVVRADGRRLRVHFRLPTGGDLEAIAGEGDALAALVRRVVVSVDGDEPLDEQALDELDAAIGERAPRVELAMDVVCPSCDAEHSLDFELAPFVLEELAVAPRQLMREVHGLAFHYRWSEEEILRMPRAKRRAYLDLIADELLDGER